ncbi:MAG: hypothetical protein AVDCRST_MAG89-2779 [uncultured Gemmatimonadetes bacterium]|uniref:PDZ domain-containing protein n=1 Tax=uncultured Gemmatimonadota bacterium TaxID=203437 RepID=A0A6J4LX51_9BACT|nr:MAG: hypothetical protein AVDCRST_MAG89-2779 [uncultured Gemmatimonadota bacterium]
MTIRATSACFQSRLVTDAHPRARCPRENQHRSSSARHRLRAPGSRAAAGPGTRRARGRHAGDPEPAAAGGAPGHRAPRIARRAAVRGLRVSGIPRAAAGFLPGDLVLSIDGRDSVERPLFPGLAPGRAYTVRVKRGEEERELRVVAAAPAAAP